MGWALYLPALGSDPVGELVTTQNRDHKSVVLKNKTGANHQKGKWEETQKHHIHF